jgi:hypothetical protein
MSKKKTGLGSAITTIDARSLTTYRKEVFSSMDVHCTRFQEELYR